MCAAGTLFFPFPCAPRVVVVVVVVVEVAWDLLPVSCTPYAWIAVVGGVVGACRGCGNLAGVTPRVPACWDLGREPATSGFQRIGMGLILDCAVPCGFWADVGHDVRFVAQGFVGKVDHARCGYRLCGT
jgi:hypothetical protein